MTSLSRFRDVKLFLQNMLSDDILKQTHAVHSTALVGVSTYHSAS